MIILFFIVVAYLVGAIPFGVVFAKLFKLGDLRVVGSGNIGATNVLRTGNKKAAALTLIMDGLKGLLMVYLSFKYSESAEYLPFLVGISAIVGHVWPVWLGFKGGKGVATALGVYIAWQPLLGVGIIFLWIIIARVFRISSLAALGALGLAPLVILGLYSVNMAHNQLLFSSAVINVIVFYTHRANIARLKQGQESTIVP